MVVASTGVIGQPLSIDPIAAGLPVLASQLSVQGSTDACEGIMTTDTYPKECAYAFSLEGVECHIGAIAKGSGMIHPNMATMLAFVTTDVAIAPALLQKAVSEVVDDTFNMVSVDGDTSTNDMLAVLANGLAGNALITAEGTRAYRGISCRRCLPSVTQPVPKELAGDGEGRHQAVGMHRPGMRQTKTDRQKDCQIGDLLQPVQGRHVRGRRQLGPGALRHWVHRCSV